MDIFVLGILSAALALLFFFGFRHLPGERWQFIAALPYRKNRDGSWEARNLTWYGFFTALSMASAIALFTLIVRSANVPVSATAIFIITIILIAAPSSKLVAFIVEKRKGTITVGGAAFVGLMIAPLAAFGLERFVPGAAGTHGPLLSGLVSAYAIGEGIGRLSCLSFGCCYGKPLNACGSITRSIFRYTPLVFRGKIKKVSYAGRMEGKELMPIQAITAVLYSMIAIISTFLALRGMFAAAFIMTSASTLLWRVISEYFRADYRGESRISAYQWMSLIGAIYAIILGLLLPFGGATQSDIIRGLKSLLDIRFVLLIQSAFICILFYMGISTVTHSTVSFELVRPDKKTKRSRKQK